MRPEWRRNRVKKLLSIHLAMPLPCGTGQCKHQRFKPRVKGRYGLTHSGSLAGLCKQRPFVNSLFSLLGRGTLAKPSKALTTRACNPNPKPRTLWDLRGQRIKGKRGGNAERKDQTCSVLGRRGGRVARQTSPAP